MDDRERIRLIIIATIMFFIITLPFVHTHIFYIFELIFGSHKIHTIKCIDNNTFNIFGRITISAIFAIILLLLL